MNKRIVFELGWLAVELTMSLNDWCTNALEIPLSEQYGWRGVLVCIQSACFCAYLAAVIIHRHRIFTQTARKWDLDHVFMALSTLAAAFGVVTWVFSMQTTAFHQLAHTAMQLNDPRTFAENKARAWTCNAVYLIFKPVSTGL